MLRNILAESDIHPAIMERVENYHLDIVNEVKQAIENNDVVVVGKAGNPHVKKARKLLENNQIPFQYLEYGSYFSNWRRRTALKMWTGWSTFPMVFVKKQFVGGAADLASLLESSELHSMIA